MTGVSFSSTDSKSTISALRKQYPMSTRDPDDPHPDDFMLVQISLSFNAKVNPDSNDPPSIDVATEYSYCLPSDEETAAYLESIAEAIRENRLFGFMQQEVASSPIGCREWIGKTLDDQVADAALTSPDGNSP